MSLTTSINELQVMLDNAKLEITALEAGKKASAPRARKHMQGIKTHAHALRKSITGHVSSIPIKKRVAKITPEAPNEVIEPAQVEPAHSPAPEPTPEPVVAKRRNRRTKTVLVPTPE